ncbi:MAG: tryptophan-rich sensory protein [Oscillospiraceae bacterium]|nr:tryptophan-rich sensory protein [Oscillospiraceae bacterium]
MKKSSWKIYAFWILFSEIVGALSGWLTRDGVKIYNETVVQPMLSPPPVVFPVVWGILFALMGVGVARIYSAPASVARSRSLLLFLVQLIFNFFWSIIFFNFQAFGFALIWLIALWVLILLMILSFGKVDKIAAWIQVPYLLWVTFAAYLNFGVWILNK